MLHNDMADNFHILKFAKRAMMYLHHFIFLQACVDHNVTPKGLSIKKTPYIDDGSPEFIRQWEETKVCGSTEFTRLLLSENKSKSDEYQMKFWDSIIKKMKGGNTNEVRELFISVMTLLSDMDADCRKRRTRKLSKLILDFSDGKYLSLIHISEPTRPY